MQYKQKYKYCVHMLQIRIKYLEIIKQRPKQRAWPGRPVIWLPRARPWPRTWPTVLRQEHSKLSSKCLEVKDTYWKTLPLYTRQHH